MKKVINWNGIIDAEVLKKMKCRIWSKKEFPLTWSGLSMELVNYDGTTGIMTAHVGTGTFIFHISSVIIQVQERETDNNEEEKALEGLSKKHKSKKHKDN